MKGKFVSGKDIQYLLSHLLYEGNLLSYDARIERLNAMFQLHLISFDEFKHYHKSIGIKFGGPVPSGELSFADMLQDSGSTPDECHLGGWC